MHRRNPNPDASEMGKITPRKRACPTSTSSAAKRVHTYDAVNKNLLLGTTWSQYQEMMDRTKNMVTRDNTTILKDPNVAMKEKMSFEWAILSRELYFQLAQINDSQFKLMDSLGLRAEWEAVASARNAYNAYPPFIGESAREMAIALAEREQAVVKKDSDASEEPVVARDFGATT